MLFKRILSTTFALSLFLGTQAFAQFDQKEPLTHTFSIVAVDSATGDIGVAVQSHWFNVGTVVPWAEAGVGAVVIQSLANVSFGPRGLELMREGKSPHEALKNLLKDDEEREYRQIALINNKGEVAVFTGDNCIAKAGHVKGVNFSVQANMMLRATAWSAMAEVFKNTKGTLAERMVSALMAAQDKGGDIRGQQSAALIVVPGKKSVNQEHDQKINLQVADSPCAIGEIARLLKLTEAYRHMNAGDNAIGKGNICKALLEYDTAREMVPENNEMKFWTAVALTNARELDKALPLFKEVFAKDRHWVELTKRIVPNGMLNVNDAELDKILDLQPN